MNPDELNSDELKAMQNNQKSVIVQIMENPRRKRHEKHEVFILFVDLQH